MTYVIITLQPPFIATHLARETAIIIHLSMHGHAHALTLVWPLFYSSAFQAFAYSVVCTTVPVGLWRLQGSSTEGFCATVSSFGRLLFEFL